jgi:hypothetical protein
MPCRSDHTRLAHDGRKPLNDRRPRSNQAVAGSTDPLTRRVTQHIGSRASSFESAGTCTTWLVSGTWASTISPSANSIAAETREASAGRARLAAVAGGASNAVARAFFWARTEGRVLGLQASRPLFRGNQRSNCCASGTRVVPQEAWQGKGQALRARGPSAERPNPDCRRVTLQCALADHDCPETGRRAEHRSLENFDESNTQKPILNSPRSVEACRRQVRPRSRSSPCATPKL